MQLENFLNQILPQEGTKCWVSIKNKVVNYGFCDHVEHLATTLLAASSQGADAYFACSVFKDATNRTKENALGAKIFWLDIDVGGEKAYKDFDEAVAAVDEFTNKLDLPLPMAVCSGYGLHCYWVLDRFLPRDEWLPIAELLKKATALHGLKADPVVTADPARILRAPDTNNYKNGGRKPVFVSDGDIELISSEEFKSKITPKTIDINASLIGGMSKGCPSMTQGFGDTERTVALQKRAGYLLATGKSYEETLKLCRDWNNGYNTPPMDDAKLVHDIGSYAKRQAAKDAADLAKIMPTEMVGFPVKNIKGFLCDAKGLYCEVTKDDIERWVPISRFPIYLKEVCRHDTTGAGQYIFNQFHPSEGWYEFSMSTEEFASSNCASILAKHRTDIENLKAFKYFISQSAIEKKKVAMDKVCHEQFGWKDNYTAFLIGNTLIKNDGTVEEAFGDAALQPLMRNMVIKPGTSLRAWTQASSIFYANGFQAHGFALLAGFAAPLMGMLCGKSEGGAVLSLYSQGSGLGKTRALEAIASIWGNYDALSTSEHDTDNAKYNRTSKLCHIPILEEEAGLRDPIKAADNIKRFTEGREKNRSQRDGTVLVKQTRYQTIKITASNYSQYEMLKMSGDLGAPARMLEINFGSVQDKEVFKHFTRSTAIMLENQGHAGRAFIHALMQPGVMDNVKILLAQAEEHFFRLLGGKTELRFVVWLMAACLVAARILNQFGILEFDINRIMTWATEKALARANDKIGYDHIELLNQFINAHVLDCLTVDKSYTPGKPCSVIKMPSRSIVMRLEVAGQRLFISTDALKKWLFKRNESMPPMIETLHENKTLINRDRMTTLTAGVPELPSTRVRCWEVDISDPAVSGGLKLVIPDEKLLPIAK
jgi:hypothetical protein